MSGEGETDAAGTGGYEGGHEGGQRGSALIRAVGGTLEGSGWRGSAGPLRSWVIGWTHRFDPRARAEAEEYADEAPRPQLPRPQSLQPQSLQPQPPGVPVYAAFTPALDSAGPERAAPLAAAEQSPPPAVVRRLVEAVVDVLLERRSAEQVRRWVSREVFGLLSTVAQRRASIRFASRSTVRSIRLHTPALDAVESTVLVQDGPRVRAVALRFERSALPTAAQARFEPGRCEPLRYEPERLEWRCTALQFA
jgi:uncharacterized protein DUF6459